VWVSLRQVRVDGHVVPYLRNSEFEADRVGRIVTEQLDWEPVVQAAVVFLTGAIVPDVIVKDMPRSSSSWIARTSPGSSSAALNDSHPTASTRSTNWRAAQQPGGPDFPRARCESDTTGDTPERPTIVRLLTQRAPTFAARVTLRSTHANSNRGRLDQFESPGGREYASPAGKEKSGWGLAPLALAGIESAFQPDNAESIAVTHSTEIHCGT
jgi:hypothetical protein